MHSMIDFTHGSYDAKAADELIGDKGFVGAVSSCLAILGTLFLESPRAERFAAAKTALAGVNITVDWPFGAPDELERAALLLAQGADDQEEALFTEYGRLFRGPAALPAPPWGSVYMDSDKVLYGWTWVELRKWMRAHGIAGVYAENDPEDHVGRMLLLASDVVRREPQLLCELLADHVMPWAPHCLELLERNAAAPTYQGIFVLTRATLQDLAGLLGIVPAKRRLYR